MADWIQCASCGLKHQQRADGNCPRCRKSTSGMAPYAPQAPTWEPSGAASPAYAPIGATIAATAPVTFSDEGEQESGFAMKAAGAVLIANGLMTVASIAVTHESTGVFIGAIVVDAILGFRLIAGDERVRSFCTWRVILGGLVFAAISLTHGDATSAVFQLVFSAALLGLLLGAPGRARTGISLAVLVIQFLLMGVGLMALRASDQAAVDEMNRQNIEFIHRLADEQNRRR